jgi:hypothetical protein
MQLPVPFLPQGADRGHVAQDPHSKTRTTSLLFFGGAGSVLPVSSPGYVAGRAPTFTPTNVNDSNRIERSRVSNQGRL